MQIRETRKELRSKRGREFHSTDMITKEDVSGGELNPANNLAIVIVIASSLALVCANPALISIRILSREPSIQRLLQVIQVLRLAIALALR